MKRIVRRKPTNAGGGDDKKKKSSIATLKGDSSILELLNSFDDYIDDDNNDRGVASADGDDDSLEDYDTDTETCHQNGPTHVPIGLDKQGDDDTIAAADYEQLHIDTVKIIKLLEEGDTLKRVYCYRGPVLGYKWTRTTRTHSVGTKSPNVSKVAIPKDIVETVELFFAILFKFTCDCEENRITPGGTILINPDRLPKQLTPFRILSSDDSLVRYILKRNLVVFDKTGANTTHPPSVNSCGWR